MGVRLMLAEGKGRWGLVGRVPRRVEAATKLALLELIDRGGRRRLGSPRRVCGYLKLAEEARVALARTPAGPGAAGRPRPGRGIRCTRSRPSRKQARSWPSFFLEAHQDTDRSHRKLAHRGSYEGIACGSRSPRVRRVLDRAPAGVTTLSRRPGPGAPNAGRSPSGTTYGRHSIWIYDTTRFARCRKSTYATMIIGDLVTRKWITEIVSAEETGLQVQLAFTARARGSRACSTPSDAYHRHGWLDPTVDDLTRAAGAARRLRQRAADDFRLHARVPRDVRDRATLRPPRHAHQDQAWIESLFSHIKADWPHLDQIRDPAVLRAELAVRGAPRPQQRPVARRHRLRHPRRRARRTR